MRYIKYITIAILIALILCGCLPSPQTDSDQQPALYAVLFSNGMVVHVIQIQQVRWYDDNTVKLMLPDGQIIYWHGDVMITEDVG